MGIDAYIVIGSAVAGMVIWAIRLEGRVNSQEKTFSLCQRNIEKSLEHVNENIGKIFERLDRLSESVNTLIGYQDGRRNGQKK